LQEPAVSGSTVLSLPAVSGTLITTGSSGQSIPKAALPTGSVLQVVNAQTTTYASSATSAWVATTLTATITPNFSTSKILVLLNQNGLSKNNNTSVWLQLLRNGSLIATPCFNGGYTANTSANYIPSAAISYLDSPATTSATTYSTQFASRGGSVNGVAVQDANETSTITLLEIAQ